LAIEKWRSYLQHQPFIIKTDHKSLLYLTEQRVTTKLQQKALMKLMDLQYSIQYKKGTTNTADDALSRCDHTEDLIAISECIPSWVQKLQEGYEDDHQAKQLLVQLAVASDSHPDFKLQNGILRYKGRVWVGHNATAQNHILIALHDSGLGGHSGISATYSRVKQLFAWPGLKQSV
jgi:hypothetical protein